MPIAPLDLQQLYMQQGNIGKLEHAKIASQIITVQSEDKDINKDSYERDSTVVKNQEVGNEHVVKEKKEQQQNRDDGRFVFYRKKKNKQNGDEDTFDTVVDDENASGKHIDLLG